jgi:hypothetical protein
MNLEPLNREPVNGYNLIEVFNMYRLLSLLIIATTFLLPNVAYSQGSVSIVILPFEIYSQEDFLYLKAEIPDVIKKHLKQDGANVIALESISGLPDYFRKKWR